MEFRKRKVMTASRSARGLTTNESAFVNLSSIWVSMFSCDLFTGIGKYPQCIAGVSGSVVLSILFTTGIEIEASQWGLREMGNHISYTATNKNQVDLCLQITSSLSSF